MWAASPDLRADSENSVLVLLNAWVEAQQQHQLQQQPAMQHHHHQLQQPSEQQLQELSGGWL